MPVEPRPPIPSDGDGVNTLPASETPALRFLRRGQQLQRLQEHITRNMLTELQREHSAFSALTITESSSQDDVKMVVDTAMAFVATGNDRVSDSLLMLQLFFCRHVDNFQIFLEETLRAVYTQQPDLLKRSEQVTVAQVLCHDSLGTFIKELIEMRIHKLAYKSIRDLASFIKEDIKFDLFGDRRTMDGVELAFDVRNLVTHSYGIVNKIFMAKHPDINLTAGDPYPVLPERIAEEIKMLVASSGDIEKRAKQKFKLYITAPNSP